MVAYLIAATTLIYAIQLSLTDIPTYAPMIVLNLALVFLMLWCLLPTASATSPAAYSSSGRVRRPSGFWDFFSREGGNHLQYIVAAAAAFVIFGLERIWLIMGVVGLGLVLHLCSWFWFPAEGRVAPHEQPIADLSMCRCCDHGGANRGLRLVRVQPG